jgi:hypothetical protein
MERDEKKRNTELIRLGSAYGHFIIHWTPFLPPKTEFGPNIEGYEPTGSARRPPDVC